MGLSLLQLATKAGIKAPSHIFHIENGEKSPSEAVALRLARALGDDEELYRAWARTLNRADIHTALEASRVLERCLEAAGARANAGAVHEPNAPFRARLVIPVISEGLDPGEGIRPSCEVLETLRLAPDAVAGLRPIERPFAWRLSPQGARRASDRLAPGAYAIVTRRFLPIERDGIHAVRTADGVILTRLWWNRRLIVLLPAEGERDVVTLEARDESELARHVVGVVALVTGEP